MDALSFGMANAKLAEMSQDSLERITGNSLLLQQLANSKGGRIGTNGKPVIAIRFDDWQDSFKTNIYPLLLERGFPCSMALISRFSTAQPWGAGTTWADIKTWNRNGVEIWSHGTDHKDYVPDGDAGLYREIVTSKAEIEAQGIKVQGWSQPGVTPSTEVVPYNGGLTSLSQFFSDVGNLLLKTYAITETDAGRFFRSLIPSEYHGLSHITISDGRTLAQCQSYVDYAINYKVGVEFMCHSGNLGAAGNMTLADFVTLLDYITTKWNNGEIEVLTPSGLVFADITTDYRVNLLKDGKFTGLTPDTVGSGDWSGTADWTGKTFPQSGGYSSGAYLNFASGSSTGSFVTFKTDGIKSLANSRYNGEQWLFEGWFRSNGSGNATARLLVQDTSDLANLNYIISKISNGTNWTRFRHVIGIPPSTNALLLGLGRSTGDSVDWSDVSLKKV